VVLSAVTSTLVLMRSTIKGSAEPYAGIESAQRTNGEVSNRWVT